MPWDRLPLTATEKQEIDQLTLAGESTRAIAAKLGCGQSAIWHYGKGARAVYVAANPTCSCGKPMHHAGNCDLAPELIASIETMTRAGAGMNMIGRELGLSDKAVRRHSRAVIDEERAAGRRCACGMPFIHRGTCRGPRGSRYEAEHFAAIRKGLEEGKLRADLAKELELDGNVVDRIARPILEEMAVAGVTCACGQSIDHRGRCAGRMRLKPGVPDKKYRWPHARRAGLPLETRKEIRSLIRTGLGAAKIARLLGLTRTKIVAVEKDLIGLGEQIPTSCACGQDRDHSGQCSRAKQPSKPYPKNRRSRMAPEVIEEIRRRAAAGESERSMAREMGIPVLSARAHVRKWVAEQVGPLPPCECGRPARHAGGCIVNSPGVLSRREEAYIEARLREGVTVADVSRETGISFVTVLKRAWPVFDAMNAAGIFCGCGRRRGHMGLCAATWTSGGRMRGPQPIPVELQQRIVNLLLRGDPLRSVQSRVETSERTVVRVFRAMNREERHRRAVAVRARIGDISAKKHSAAVFERIMRALPRSADRSIRDDAASELYLAVLQGDLREDRIEAAAKAYLGRAYTEWQSAYGPRSLDAQIHADGTRTLGDMVEDDTAAAHIEQMEIGS